PQTPETGYGDVQRDTLLSESLHTFAVRRFVERTDVATAQGYIEAGDYYWNSSMFVFQSSSLLANLYCLETSNVANCRAAIQNGKQDLDFFRLEPKAFESCKSISIDYAVMEHTQKAAIVPVEMGWSDIGSWEALWDASGKDDYGNALMGDVLH